jgi:hypothetical protein
MSKQSPIFCCDEAARGDLPVREIHEGGPFDLRLEYVCQECFTPQQIGGDDCGGNYPAACGVMDGPAWDELGPVVTL